MLKKITLVVLGLTAGGYALAGTMGPSCMPGNVTVPCQARQWDLGVQALYLRSVFGGSRALLNNTIPGTFPLGLSEVKNSWDWGYKLNGAYHFNTGNDLSLTLLHFKNTTNLAGFSATTPIAGTINFPFTLAVRNQFDQVNMTIGQRIDVSAVDSMRFYGGLQYAHIVANRNAAFTGVPVIAGTNLVGLETADYKGLGPVIGLDYAYRLTQALSVTANGSGAFLYGKNRFSNTVVVNPIGGLLLPRYGYKKSVVPSLEARLGLNYDYLMFQGVLSLEGGFEAANYYNALQSVNNTPVVSTGYAETDYSMYGPYFGVKYKGNV